MSYENYFHSLILFWVCIAVVYCLYVFYKSITTPRKELLEALEKRKERISRKGNFLVFVLLILYFVISIMTLSSQRERQPVGNAVYVCYFAIEVLGLLLFFQFRKTKISKRMKLGNLIIKLTYLWPIFFVNSDVLFFVPLFSAIHLLIFFFLVAKCDNSQDKNNSVLN